MTENLLLAAKQVGVQKVCQMSSNSVYSSENKIPFNEKDNPIPATIYGVSKVYAEKLGEYFSYKSEVKVISLRLARLFGYGERSSVVFTKYMIWPMMGSCWRYGEKVKPELSIFM